MTVIVANFKPLAPSPKFVWVLLVEGCVYEKFDEANGEDALRLACKACDAQTAPACVVREDHLGSTAMTHANSAYYAQYPVYIDDEGGEG